MVLKALILVGGYGTRLRPLTFTKPKPLCEFVNKPIVLHQIEALAKVGVKEIILAVSYKPEQLKHELKNIASKLNIKIHFTLETIPMGTAGPIKLNENLLDIHDSDPFFMLNADVIADYQFQNLLNFHRKHNGEGTIYVTAVENPKDRGVVVADRNGKVQQFVEKPKDMQYGNEINAGLYILNKSVIKRVPLQPTSIERVIFPAMVREGELYDLALSGYWMDLGKPSDFLTGQNVYLKAIAARNDNRIAKDSNVNWTIEGLVVIDDTASIGNGSVLGPNVVIGPNAQIGMSVRIMNSVIMSDVTIMDGCYVSGSIIGWKSKLGRWSRLENLCVLGEDVKVKENVALNGIIIAPHVKVLQSIVNEPGKVMLMKSKL